MRVWDSLFAPMYVFLGPRQDSSGGHRESETHAGDHFRRGVVAF